MTTEHLTENFLPTFNLNEDDGNRILLPLHVLSLESHECIFCGEAPIWDTYAEYLEHWYLNEYEGERYHEPSTEESFEWVTSSCLAGESNR